MAEDINSFDETLHALDSGACIIDANRLERELIMALREVADEHGVAKGKLTLTLSFTAEKKGSVAVGYALKVDAPKAPTRNTTLYTTAKGGLADSDPRQGKLKILRDPKRAPTNTDGGESS